MKRAIYFLFLLPSFMFAQRNIGGAPQTSLRGLETQNIISLDFQQPNMTQVDMEDQLNFESGKAPRFGVKQLVNSNLLEIGDVEEYKNGDRLTRMKIRSKNAKTLNFLFDHFYLSKGTRLYIFRPDMKQVIGGFTSINNKGITPQDKRGFGTSLIQGDEAIIEIYEPASAIGKSIINLQYVVHGYRMVTNHFDEDGSGDFGDSGNCQVNKNCPEGDNWQDQSRGVALILVNGNTWCSGTLLNNTLDDCTPYFLTANHCTDDFGEAGTNLDFTSFLWGYESEGCDNGVEITAPCTNGAVIRANGAHTDFSLLELDENPVDAGIDVVFNGWSREVPGTGGALIHHPSGDIMKIGTIEVAFQVGTNADPIAPPQPNNYWFIDDWAVTANGHSVPEGGSSGAGIFNSDGLLIAQHRRSGTQDCSNPNSEVGWFGRFDISWDQVNTTESSLQPWLDPNNTGVMEIQSSVCDGCDVTDSSNFEIESYCDNGTWKVNVTASDLDPENHWWGLYETDEQGETNDSHTIAGPFNIQNGITAHWGWLDQSKRYYVKHGIWSPDCYEWRETRIPVEPFYVDPADFTINDEDGIANDTFCVGDDIWVDGTATIGEDRYNIHAWRIVDGEKQWFGSLGWFFGDMTQVNISEEFANLANPQYFNPGEYLLTIAFANPSQCEVWTPIEKEFKVECCDDDGLDASFVVDVSQGNIYTVNGFNTYSNHDVEHQWYLFTSTDNILSQDDTFVASGSGTSFTHTATNSDLFYIFIHKIVSECGEICFGVVQYQDDVKSLEENMARARIDCSILDEFCLTLSPTNLQIDGASLSWDPVPGAIGYIIESTPFWPINCRCDYPVSIATIETEETNVELPISEGRCFVVQIRARCSDGTISEPSDWLCVGGGGKPKSFQEASISPNPTSGDMVFNIRTIEETEVSIEIRNFYGTLIKSFDVHSSPETISSVSWNGTNLIKGVYFVTFKTSIETIYKKVIVE